MRSAADAAPSFLYVPDLTSRAAEFTLEGDEARYLSRVVRAREGERVTASDGEGALATLVVVHARPAPVVSVESRRAVPAPQTSAVLCGAPEGERGDWLVEKLAELGVCRFVPLECERGRWTGPPRIERWERLAVAALRQSRAAWLMRIAPPAGLEEAVATLGAGPRWLADPDGSGAGSLLSAPDEPIAGAVGPSSGFSADERKFLSSHGFVPVCLAPLRLRTETAAVALAVLWAACRTAATPESRPNQP